MNRKELAALAGGPSDPAFEDTKQAAESLARHLGRCVFITLAERGMLGASPSGTVHHVPALPVHGDIDIVGAGDAVTANLTAALAAGSTLQEALEIANAAASIVIHQLGTTGTATPRQIQGLVVHEDTSLRT
jgi:bifunctional ADP-heptose synthase (sugar kinase/adenylyltransferase)